MVTPNASRRSRQPRCEHEIVKILKAKDREGAQMTLHQRRLPSPPQPLQHLGQDDVGERDGFPRFNELPTTLGLRGWGCRSGRRSRRWCRRRSRPATTSLSQVTVPMDLPAQVKHADLTMPSDEFTQRQIHRIALFVRVPTRRWASRKTSSSMSNVGPHTH